MKKIFLFFLAAIVSNSLFANEQPICGKTIYATLDNCEAFIDLRIVDNNTSFKDAAIADLLKLRGSLLIDPIPEKLPDGYSNGFLLLPMPPDFMHYFLNEKHGKLLLAYLDEQLVGYLIFTDATTFMGLYHGDSSRYFECNVDLKNLEREFLTKRVAYIAEIAVKPGYFRKGIGNTLVNASKRLAPDGLIADIYLYPFINAPSIDFFAKKEFQEIGIWHQTEGPPRYLPLKSSVVYWSPNFTSLSTNNTPAKN